METVDPFSRHTWRNHPAPKIDPSLEEALTAIGGTVPYGEHKGKPQIRFEWGQSEKTFRAGRMRLKYVDTSIPPIETPRGHLARTTTEFERFDENGQPVYKVERIPVKEAPQVIPAGYTYIEDLPSLEWIGKQLWYITQWIPPDKLGSEELWEEHRYGNWEDPETGQTTWTDMAGPFPRGGRWNPVFMISVKRTARVSRYDSFLDKNVIETVEHDFYAEPTSHHVELVRKAWYERRHGKAMTAEQISKSAFAADVERKQAAGKKMRKERRLQVNDLIKDARPRVSLASAARR